MIGLLNLIQSFWSNRQKEKSDLDKNQPSVELLLNKNEPMSVFDSDFHVSVVNTGHVPVTVQSLSICFGHQAAIESTPPSGTYFGLLRKDELISLDPARTVTRNLPKKEVWDVVKPMMGEQTIGVRLVCGLVGEKEYLFSSGKRSLGPSYFQRWE